MANELTGDFDVVAEFSVPGVNRLLAATHTGTRFLHSITATQIRYSRHEHRGVAA